MIGGMVKKDCDDPDDIGQYCWSDNTQALVLGAYFYGYTAQCLTTFVAKKYTGKDAMLTLCFKTILIFKLY